MGRGHNSQTRMASVFLLRPPSVYMVLPPCKYNLPKMEQELSENLDVHSRKIYCKENEGVVYYACK